MIDTPSPLHSTFAEGANEAFAANFGYAKFYFGTLGRGDEARFEVAEAACFVLTDEFADVLARRAPIAGSDLAFDVFFECFRERDIQRGHGHGFII
jgi:hypothetical protein